MAAATATNATAGRRPAAPLAGVVDAGGSAVEGEGDISGVGEGGEETGASGAGAAADGVGAGVGATLGAGAGADLGGATGAGVGGGIAGGGDAAGGGGAWGAAAGAAPGACAVAATARSARTERMARGEAAIVCSLARFFLARFSPALSASAL